ncbi:MAG: NAD-binding protein [Proteobacteria bacterium]|nr:NAD-binding protein [Pseudomonadota bacterium]MBU1456819.1 NAD-binding protein [Pseudomonadota bacterium]
MKMLLAQLLFFVRNKEAKKNVDLLLRFLFFLTFIIALYSITFHLIMLYEGRNFSLITGFYWTLTVMSTLGFGDITFSSDLGLLFTLLVLISGIILLLIMLPFTFIQFFYAPWLQAQNQSRTPRFLPETIRGHVLLTNFDALTRNLVKKLKKHHYDYTFINGDQQKALEIYDAGYKVVLGDVDNPDTYQKTQAAHAALIVATADDLINTNISFTVREISNVVPIASSADKEHSLDILNFPGNTHVFQFMKMLGVSLAEKTIGVVEPNIIGRFQELLIGEFPVRDTILTGQTLAQSRLRQTLGLTVIGFLERGQILPPDPQTVLTQTNILILAGTQTAMERTGRQLAAVPTEPPPDPSVLILGGGRVGQAAADFLLQNSISYKIVEKMATVRKGKAHCILGDAADIKTLEKAGINKARSVIITTHTDAMNIYLSFYCRQLRPDIQIITRATEERTMPKLHRAGADLVVSSAAMGANSIMNLLQPSDVSIFSEELNVFLVPIPAALAGKTLIEIKLREQTGCSVLAIKSAESFLTNPDPTTPLAKAGELLLAGSLEAEKVFRQEYLN